MDAWHLKLVGDVGVKGTLNSDDDDDEFIPSEYDDMWEAWNT